MQDIKENIREEIELLNKVRKDLENKCKEISEQNSSPDDIQGSLPGFESGIQFFYLGREGNFSFRFRTERKQGGKYEFYGNIPLGKELEIGVPCLVNVSTINPYTRFQNKISKAAQQAFEACIDELMAAAMMFVQQNKEEFCKAMVQSKAYRESREITGQYRSQIWAVRHHCDRRRQLLSLLEEQMPKEVKQLTQEASGQIALTV